MPTARSSRPRVFSSRWLAPAALGLALAAGPAGAAGMFPIVLRIGDPAPGLPGVAVQAFGGGSLSPGGRIAHTLHLSGAGVTGANNSSLWLENAGGALELAFREGDPAPGTGGDTYRFDVYGHAHGAPGELFFHTSLITAEGTWLRDAAGGVSLVIREGDPAPLVGPGVVYGCCFNSLETDANGRLSFASFLAGTGIDDSNDEALWIRDPDGTLILRARAGEPAPGAAPDVEHSTLRTGAELGSSGRLTFAERTISASNPQYPFFPDGYGLWTAPDSTAPLAAELLTGDPPPGGAPGEVLDAVWTNDASASGEELVGNVRFAGPAVTFDDDDGVFATDGAGGFRLLMREGDPAAGVSDGALWGHVSIQPFSPARINDAGEVAIPARLEGPSVTGSNDYGVWLADPAGQLELLVREGSPVPDRPDYRVESLTGFPAQNERGDVVIVATLREISPPPGLPFPRGGTAILVRVAGGGVQTLVRVGERLAVAPGDFRQVSGLTLGGLGDAGELTFSASFTSSSATLFRTSLAEPACADGEDDDGDGLVDLADPGCSDAGDLSENQAALDCDDGDDDDLDGFVDYPGDPGCVDPLSWREKPQCQDGLNNDSQPGIDFDGGASVNGGVPLAAPDPQCTAAWVNKERAGCGLGFEIALCVPLLVRLSRKGRRR